MKNWKGNIGLMACVFLFVLGNLFSGSQSDPEGKVAIVCFLEGKAWILEPEEKERRMDGHNLVTISSLDSSLHIRMK